MLSDTLAVVLVLGGAAALVTLMLGLRARARRRLARGIAEVAAHLALEVTDDDGAVGRLEGETVFVRWTARALGRGARAVTVCGARLDPPLDLGLVLGYPRSPGGHAHAKLRTGHPVYHGARHEETGASLARALEHALAAAARDAYGAEVDDVSALVLLDGHALEAEAVRDGLTRASALARAAREAVARVVLDPAAR